MRILKGAMNLKQHLSITYESEIQDTLDRLGRENSHILSFSWFLDRTKLWFDREIRKNLKPRIAVLGPGIPEELILATGAQPYFIIGGSLRSGDWSDALVPRDTDPISRSILGFLNDPDGPDYSNTLFIIPAQNDNFRKIAWMLEREGKKIHVVDIPPQREDLFTKLKWREQMMNMTDDAASHMKTRISFKRLAKVIHDVDTARKTFRIFLSLTSGRQDLLTGAARLLIQNSYYYVGDPVLWTEHLQLLNEELQKKLLTADHHERNKHPGILLLGSPVCFPNYKIPFLIEDIGMTILYTIDPSILTFFIEEFPEGKEKKRRSLINAVADRWYLQDASSAYIKNDALHRSVRQCLDEGQTRGVVYHVLKGQIEYDFELERFEKLFDELEIPVFRLETDYQYQDLEQLRVRMEAFSEMLTQNRYREEQMV